MELLEFLRTDDGFEAIQKPPYSVKVRRHAQHPNLIQFGYDQIESEKNPITNWCRGIILDENENWNVVAFPFRRFANFGETWADSIDWKTAKVFDKCDGSLIIVYHYLGQWFAATRNVPDAGMPVHPFSFSFSELFWGTFHDLGYNKSQLDVNYTYMFELMTPYNMVVVRHTKSNIVMLGARNNATFAELDIVNHDVPFDKPRIFPATSIEECVELSNQLEPTEQEGFVIVDGNFNRVKVKSPKYVLWSHVRFNFTPLRMLELYVKGEHGEYISYYPEHQRFLDHIETQMDLYEKELTELYKEATTKATNQKEFALMVKDNKWSGVLFSMRAGKVPNIRSGMLASKLDFLYDRLSMDSIPVI